MGIYLPRPGGSGVLGHPDYSAVNLPALDALARRLGFRWSPDNCLAARHD